MSDEQPEIARDVQDAVEKLGATLAQVLNGALVLGITEGLALQKALNTVREAGAWPAVQHELVSELAKRNTTFKTVLRDILRREV